MKKSAILLAVLALSASCSRVDKAEKNMDTMKAKTEKMSETTSDMKETTSTMYEQIRSKEAEDTRSEKFAILYPKGGFGNKLADAAVYYKSLEFQLATKDNQHRREMMLDAVNEFTRRICDLHEAINIKKMSPTKTSSRHADEQAFYALAATMHMNHLYQEHLAKKSRAFQLTSFYDIVKSALAKDAEGRNDELTEYERVLVVGVNKEIMLDLLQARMDMLAVLGLKNLTDKRKMNLKQMGKGLLFKISAGQIGEIDLPETFENSNDTTKEQVITYLDGALKVKTFLQEINIEAKLEKTVRSGLKNLELKIPEHEVGDGQISDAGGNPSSDNYENNISGDKMKDVKESLRLKNRRDEIQDLINKLVE